MGICTSRLPDMPDESETYHDMIPCYNVNSMSAPSVTTTLLQNVLRRYPTTYNNMNAPMANAHTQTQPNIFSGSIYSMTVLIVVIEVA